MRKPSLVVHCTRQVLHTAGKIVIVFTTSLSCTDWQSLQERGCPSTFQEQGSLVRSVKGREFLYSYMQYKGGCLDAVICGTQRMASAAVTPGVDIS